MKYKTWKKTNNESTKIWKKKKRNWKKEENIPKGALIWFTDLFVVYNL